MVYLFHWWLAYVIAWVIDLASSQYVLMLSDVEWLKREVHCGAKYTVVKYNCEVGYCLSINVVLMKLV